MQRIGVNQRIGNALGSTTHWGQPLTIDISMDSRSIPTMVRPLRVEFEGACYHVTARGNERREVFRSDDDRRLFLKTLGEAAGRFGLVLHAYCLMPNHYHLLVRTPRGNLSRGVGWVQATYCGRFNRRHRRCGHLVQGRFKAHLIGADDYARRVVRYVHLNPVRPRDRHKPIPADREQALDAYPWSSHRAYAGLAKKGESPGWLGTEWLSYWDDGSGSPAKARRAYAADVRSCFGQAVASPWDELRGGLVLGGEALWKKAKSLLADSPREPQLRWLKRAGAAQLRKRVAELVAAQTDWRIGLWLRLCLGGERARALARELGYADGSGVLRVAQRLDAAATRDPGLQKELDVLREQV